MLKTVGVTEHERGFNNDEIWMCGILTLYFPKNIFFFRLVTFRRNRFNCNQKHILQTRKSGYVSRAFLPALFSPAILTRRHSLLWHSRRYAQHRRNPARPGSTSKIDYRSTCNDPLRGLEVRPNGCNGGANWQSMSGAHVNYEPIIRGCRRRRLGIYAFYRFYRRLLHGSISRRIWSRKNSFRNATSKSKRLYFFIIFILFSLRVLSSNKVATLPPPLRVTSIVNRSLRRKDKSVMFPIEIIRSKLSWNWKYNNWQ